MTKNGDLFEGKRLKAIKEVCIEYIGEKETLSVFEKAKIISHEISEKYGDIPDKEKAHTDLIFPHIAVYKTLLENHGDKAMEIMEKGEARSAEKTSETYRKFVKIPFGKTLFLKIFAAGCKSGFGEEAGFENVVHKANGNVYKMDITKCPYVKYCSDEGVYELTHIFCNNDVYAYGSLDGITFTRTETLGTGGEKCDFLLERKKENNL